MSDDKKIEFYNFKKKLVKNLTKALYYKFINDKRHSMEYFLKISKLNKERPEYGDNFEILIDSLIISLYYAIESYDIVSIRKIMDDLSSNLLRTHVSIEQSNCIELLKARIEVFNKIELKNISELD
jgi:hypothetical protein